MTVLPITNTRQLPAADFVAVQDKDQTNALKRLETLAQARGVEIGEKVYCWGQGYYYAEITKEQA